MDSTGLPQMTEPWPWPILPDDSDLMKLLKQSLNDKAARRELLEAVIEETEKRKES
jgi:hypothetical protein